MYYPNTNNNGFLFPNVDNNSIMTNVIRCKKKKYINIDSRFFTNNNIHLFDELKNVSSLKVLQVDLPLSFNNISSYLGNNHFIIKSLDVTKQYNVDDFYCNYESNIILQNNINKIINIDLYQIKFVSN